MRDLRRRPACPVRGIRRRLDGDDSFLAPVIPGGGTWADGRVEAPVEMVEALEAVQGSGILCPHSLHQLALTDYVRAGIATDNIRPYLPATAKLYEAAAKHPVQAINEHLKLLCQKTAVIVVPWWGFGNPMTEALRLSYGPPVNNLDPIDVQVSDRESRTRVAVAALMDHREHIPAQQACFLG